MSARHSIASFLAAALLASFSLSSHSSACCPLPPNGYHLVNADQTVVIVWDPATKTQHFIRKATFHGNSADFGFIVPTPSQPELAESGEKVYPVLTTLTEPRIVRRRQPSNNISCGCSFENIKSSPRALPTVEVLDRQQVAGFDAVVLKAESADALTDWLKEHDFANSPEIQDWAKPYIDQGWKFTALKIAKPKEAAESPFATAKSLRLSFQTDRPLFPYREPEPKEDAAALGVKARLLRIYFVSDTRYHGALTEDVEWTGRVVYSKKLADWKRSEVLRLLELPETTGPAECWLTEFEDYWPYRAAPADLYFAPDAQPHEAERPPVYVYTPSPWPTDATAYAIALFFLIGPFWRRALRDRRAKLANDGSSNAAE